MSLEQENLQLRNELSQVRVALHDTAQARIADGAVLNRLRLTLESIAGGSCYPQDCTEYCEHGLASAALSAPI